MKSKIIIKDFLSLIIKLAILFSFNDIPIEVMGVVFLVIGWDIIKVIYDFSTVFLNDDDYIYFNKFKKMIVSDVLFITSMISILIYVIYWSFYIGNTFSYIFGAFIAFLLISYNIYLIKTMIKEIKIIKKKDIKIRTGKLIKKWQHYKYEKFTCKIQSGNAEMEFFLPQRRFITKNKNIKKGEIYTYKIIMLDRVFDFLIDIE